MTARADDGSGDDDFTAHMRAHATEDAERQRREAARAADTERMMTESPDILSAFHATWARSYSAMPAPRCLVGNLIASGSLVCLFGESNTGKSTLAIDIAFACGRGVPWHGRRTRKALTVYLPLEGAHGVRQRVRAKMRREGIAEVPFVDLSSKRGDGRVPIDLLDPVSVSALIADLTLLRADSEAELLLIVDTVARAIAGGDENSGLDMGRLIASCDQIRLATGCTVMLIHHSGKDSTKGARGHSSLRAAVDTEIEVASTTNPRTATVRKQRDLPSGDVFAFDIEPVEVGTDPETFEPVTACVVVHRDYHPPTKQPSGRAQTDILRALRNRQDESNSPLIWTVADLRKIGRDLGQHKGTARSAVDGLIAAGFMTPTIGGHRLSE